MTEQGPLLANLLSQKERDNQRLSLNPNPISSVENFLIDISMKYFTLRGITSNLVNFYYVLDQILNDADLQRKFIVAMNQANFSHSRDDWRSVGLYVGMLINQITGYRIPGYEFIYGQSVIRDLQAAQAADATT